MGVTIQKKIIREAAVFASAHHYKRKRCQDSVSQAKKRRKRTGTAKGLPIAEIIAQSKVKMPIPNPDSTPNNWLTTALLGANQHIQLKMLSAVKRYPGNQ
jgi:hypothetical protein